MSIYSCMLKLQSPSKYFPFDVIHLSRCFFHCPKQFLNSSILMPFSASAFFYFISSTSAKPFPLRTFFIQGNNKKSCWGWDWVNREGGVWGSCHFWPKTAEYSAWCGRVHYHEVGKWVERVLNKFTEAEHILSQQRQLVHWHRCVPRTLT